MKQMEQTMSEMFETIKTFFFNDEWYFTEMENRPVLKMNHYGENGRFPCEAEINEKQQIFYFYSFYSYNFNDTFQSLIKVCIDIFFYIHNFLL